VSDKGSWQLDLINAHATGWVSDDELTWIVDGRLGRRARVQVCAVCHRVVIYGLDADRCALTATVDAHPITAAGEVEAIRAGRRTYELARMELHPRDRWNIPGRPPSHRLIVLADHDHKKRIPDSWLMPPAPSTPPKPPKEMF
jgi:hypothetical protein